jgi:predicted phosphodiesterase
MRVAVFGDAHAHAEALDAVIAAADEHGAQELWSLGDMIGRGPDPEHVVARTRERCRVALMGNHDYAATGAAEPARFGEPGSPAVRSLELARDRLATAELDWMRTRKPAARRDGVQCWHGGPRNAVHEYVGKSNAAACLATQRAPLGLVAHTHLAAAWRQTPRGAAAAARIRVGEPIRLDGKWLLNPGAVGAPVPPRVGWFADLDAQAADGAFWLLLDLDERTATWRRAAYDPVPARRRARALGIDDA